MFMSKEKELLFSNLEEKDAVIMYGISMFNIPINIEPHILDVHKDFIKEHKLSFVEYCMVPFEIVKTLDSESYFLLCKRYVENCSRFPSPSTPKLLTPEQLFCKFYGIKYNVLEKLKKSYKSKEAFVLLNLDETQQYNWFISGEGIQGLYSREYCFNYVASKFECEINVDKIEHDFINNCCKVIFKYE